MYYEYWRQTQRARMKDMASIHFDKQYIGWQWCNFFIFIYASCSGHHDVGKEIWTLSYVSLMSFKGDSTKFTETY